MLLGGDVLVNCLFHYGITHYSIWNISLSNVRRIVEIDERRLKKGGHMLTAIVIGSVISFLSYLVYRLPEKKEVKTPQKRLVFAMVRKAGITHIAVDATSNKKAA